MNVLSKGNMGQKLKLLVLLFNLCMISKTMAENTSRDSLALAGIHLKSDEMLHGAQSVRLSTNLLYDMMLLFFLSFLFVSCDYKDLYYAPSTTQTVQVKVPVDWTEFDEEKPTGMTVMAYPDDKDKPVTVLTNDLRSAQLSLEEGGYNMLVFNQSTAEYSSFRFEGMDDLSTACVKATPFKSRWYKSRTDNDEAIEQPEWLADGSISHVVVRQDMLGKDSVFVTDTVKPINVIYTIHVRIHVKGINNIRSARASLDGMADGYMFASNKPTTSRMTQLLEKWSLQPDADNPANGVLSATIQSFGLPADHEGKAEENELALSLLLVDNKTQLDYQFYVGDKFKASMEDSNSGSSSSDTDVDIDVPITADVDLDLSLDMEIDTAVPDVKPENGSSGGFDATVDDWGDEVKIDIDT